jgi:glycolate oxidase iron-sulfur subunit
MSGSNFLQQLDYSILQQCIHCGLCLPTCPTYDATKQETSSPRGRIALMRAVADGSLSAHSRQFRAEMFFCLGCLACETACPAGVNYAAMLEHARAQTKLRGAGLLRWLFTRPERLRAVARLLRLRIPSSLLPGRWRELDALRPPIGGQFSFDLIREVEQPESIRYRVGLLTGCVQDIVYADVNRDTVDVLLANGCEVVTPRAQVCCGSVLAHNGEWESAQQLVRVNQAAFKDVDVIIVNSAGCGSFMKRQMERVRDVSEFLIEIGLKPPQAWKARVVYHDACHLVHGQKISQSPRDLLCAIPGLELVELAESTWCCGSAGIYNLTQPEMSMALLERKMKNIAATGATIVAVGNPGCMNQLRYGAKRFGVPVEVLHPVTLLARAYRS